MASTSPRTPRLKPERRRQQLLEAALDVLGQRGFGGLTIEAIAARAGITRPVVYDAFGDLQSLQLALLEHAERCALGPLLEIVDVRPGDAQDPDEFLAESVVRFLEAVRRDPRTWRLVLSPPRGSSPQLRARIRASRLLIADHVQRLLDWGVPLRGGPSGLDHALAARLIVAAGEDAARLMLAHPRRFTPARLGALVGELAALAPRTATAAGPPPPSLLALIPGGAKQPASAGPLTKSTPSTSPGAMQQTPGEGPQAHAPARRMPREQRREQLLDVTLSLLAHEGFDGLTMEAIARRAGVNRVIVYRSFANLQVLLGALLHREDRRIMAELEHIIPTVGGAPAGDPPAVVLGEGLARLLAAVCAAPERWRLALARPEDAPAALRALVSRRRAMIARRLEPVVLWAIESSGSDPARFDGGALARLVLSVCEEQGRLLLDDPDYDAARLLAGSWALLGAGRQVAPVGGEGPERRDEAQAAPVGDDVH